MEIDLLPYLDADENYILRQLQGYADAHDSGFTPSSYALEGPGKRVAASLILMESNEAGEKFPRGVKHILIPAQTGTACQDITLRCIPFSLPEALDPSGNTGTICNARNFSIQVIANYVDTDFTCCEETATV